ncbi:MAG: hypothetical protein GQE15_41895 [Archangiaceae bacterium]|nr:hypothetical protein [Archangiaceae bacterium]
MRASNGALTTRLVWLVVGVVTAMGCSSMGGMGGCAALQPIPTGRYSGPKNDNAVNIRLSPQGINYLNSNWEVLAEMFAPGRTLSVGVPCTVQNVNVVGDIAIADMGGMNCTGESCGRQDGECNATGAKADLPANVAIQITGFSLVPRAPNAIEAQVQLSVDTSTILAASKSANFLACIGLSRMKCGVRFNTAARSPNDNRLKATVTFSIDQKWDKLLAFSISSISGSDVCGASGAPMPPECLQPEDITLSGQNTCGDIYCDTLDVGVIKGTILRLISPLLQTQIRSTLATQSCESCGGMGMPPCPTVGTATSVCQANVCKDAADNTKCVPRFLGVEGRMNLGATLGAFGAPPNAQMDLSFAAGSSVTVDQGLSFGTRVGVKAVNVAPCVAPNAAPPIVAVSAPNFDMEAPSRMLPDGGTTRSYHAAIGLSSPFLNLTFHEAQQAGALCLQLDTNNVGLINTGLFKTFLPSLGKLATRDGKDAPMMVALRPGRAPTIVVGEGTVDPVTKRPIKPLITLALTDLSIDFYAMIDDRYARLFTLTADISLPLSLIFEGCDKVTPAIGDLKMLITNVRTANSEMLAEDPKVLEDLIPAVIGLAEPAVAGGLSAFSLPSLGNFKLRITGVKGISQIAGTETYNHLGLFAELLPPMAACAVTAPRTIATLRASEVPTAAQMRLVGKKLTWPVALLDVQSVSKEGTTTFSAKIDDGLWSEFLPAENGVLRVSHPRFLIQGQHTISVRSRVEEDPHGISEPVQVPFFIDWDAPEVKLSVDRESDLVIVKARDVLTPVDQLQYAYAVGDAVPGPFGAARDISLSAIEAQGGVRVLVKDATGNVGEARYRPAAFGAQTTNDSVVEAITPIAPQQQGGCTAAPGLLALAALVFFRRRR